VTWGHSGAVGAGVPDWTLAKLGFLPTSIWAPSVSRRGGRLNIYYCVSSFGTNNSAIGLMTNDAFDPKQPGKGWTDRGMILKSAAGDDFNAIDPFRIDLADGRAFLSYGSFWSGIKLRELDPETGRLLKPGGPAYALAARPGGGAVEASAILLHAGKFYLFVSFDQCCKGVASTYNMRVGRADRIEGPYRDKQGKDTREGGGSLLQATSGRFIGPGGQEPVKTSRGDWLAYHYYDGDDGGASKLQLSPLGWSPDGWPELGALPR
jgi:arabinan endo-1,5-alpha-L-arabinosidase